MVTEVKLDNLLPAGTRITPAKVQPVQPVTPAQKLPGSGNDLPPETSEKVDRTVEIKDAVRDLNNHAQFVQRELQFSIDDNSGQTVIKVLDTKTKEVIRQIPGEEALRFASMLNEGAEIELINTYT
jgi:flagellar protein FlaG